MVLITQVAVAVALSVIVVFFTTLLVLGVIKSFKLKKENERLEAMSSKMDDEKDKPYKDFTQGHMYN
jgi:uncharacterized membrane protein